MVKKTVSVLLFCVVYSFAFGQSVKDLTLAGDKFYSKKNYSAAIRSFSQALAVNPDDANLNFKLGLAYLYSDTKSKAAAFIDKAYRLNPNINSKIDYYLGIAFQNTNEIKKAIEHFESFKKKNPNVASVADEKIAQCRVADSLAQFELNVVIENLGAEINSRFMDHSPILSADGNTLIFTSTRPDDPNATDALEDVDVQHKN
ncbi:MAG TPA: hypothetical protein DGG95_03980, partial [Cytophagales bacterium]|nr:hypothetical protein [Cytophagales bacterium]